MSVQRILKILSLIVLVALVAPITVVAGDGTDVEPKNTLASAELISWRTNTNNGAGTSEVEYVVGAVGYIAYSGDVDYYKIYLQAGTYSLSLTNNNTTSTSDIFGQLPGDYDIELRNSSDQIVSGSGSYGTGNAPEQSHFTVSSAGYYYVRIWGFNGAYSSSVAYKMMMAKGDIGFLMDTQRYRLYPHSFYGRLGTGSEYHATGLAYSYGSKDSLSTYETKMDEADLFAVQPLDNWSDYSASHPRPGRLQSEWDAGDTSSTAWAGIDCSGLLVRAALASEKSYVIESVGVNNCNTTCLMDDNNTTLITWSGALNGTTIIVKSGHAATVSRLASSQDKAHLIHAVSLDLSKGGRVVQETRMTALADWNNYQLRNLD